MSLTPIDASSEIAVTGYLENARRWLATAVEETGPEQIAAAKAQIATAAEATKQLGLSKEIQLDAQEMVRRAEYALGKAIRKGQAEGTVAKRGAQPKLDQREIRPVTDFGTYGELYGRDGKAGVIDLADELPDEPAFDAAIDEAKAEGNLSRANVARKAAGAAQPHRRPLPDAARAAGWNLNKAVERIERLIEDDRFPENKSEVAPHLQSHLTHTVEVCQDLLDRIE